MKRRFNELISVIKKGVVDQDCFGLSIQTNQMNTPGNLAFAFPRSSDKIAAFMKWLKEQVDKGLLEVSQYQQIGNAVEQAWTNMYINDSYKRGVIRARYELQKAGATVPSIEDSGGINVAMMNPFHMDRVGVLFTRVYSDLVGITTAMDTLISRVLAQGMIDGDGMALIARKLIAVITGAGAGDLAMTDSLGRYIPASVRAEMLARTEIIRAHHLATIQEYRNWGIEGVSVQGEWKTAGDERVCQECADMEGKIFTLDEIEPMIPLHPQCRCIALPYIEDIQKYR
jgi:SPP1 gp7 family putative phage head morphogenesis protein